MPSVPHDEFVEVNGTRLHYLEGGDPKASPLLLVHGLTREAHSFDPVFEQLGGRYRCIAPDMRGRGQSGRSPAEQYNTAQYVDDLLGFLDALKLQRVNYLGTSMGGIIGMSTAARAPERFLRVALNDIGPETAGGGSQKIQGHLANAPKSFASRAAALDYEKNRFPWLRERTEAQVEAQYRHMLVQDEDGSWRFHYDPNIRHGRAATPEARAKQAETCWAGFKALNCPLLLIRGTETDLLSVETVDAMRAAQPRLIVAEIPGVGHAPALIEPESVAALDSFFAGQPE